MKDNPIQLEYLKSVLLSQLLLECNENLRFTKQYNGALKHLLIHRIYTANTPLKAAPVLDKHQKRCFSIK